MKCHGPYQPAKEWCCWWMQIRYTPHYSRLMKVNWLWMFFCFLFIYSFFVFVFVFSFVAESEGVREMEVRFHLQD